MLLADVIPLFPPGVHDLVSEPIDDGMTRLSCSAGDWGRTDVRTADEIAWVRSAHAVHAAHHRGRCHVACYDEHGHTDGCLYDGDEI